MNNLRIIDLILAEFKSELLELANKKKYANIELTASLNILKGEIVDKYNIRINKSEIIK